MAVWFVFYCVADSAAGMLGDEMNPVIEDSLLLDDCSSLLGWEPDDL